MDNIRIQPCYYIQYITTKYSYAEIPSSYSTPSLMGNKKPWTSVLYGGSGQPILQTRKPTVYPWAFHSFLCSINIGNCPDFHILRKAKRLIYILNYMSYYIYFSILSVFFSYRLLSINIYIYCYPYSNQQNNVISAKLLRYKVTHIFWNNISFSKVFFALLRSDDLQIVSKPLALIPTIYIGGRRCTHRLYRVATL